jgi:hypothetical protein
MLHQFEKVWPEVFAPSFSLDVVGSTSVKIVVVLFYIAVPTHNDYIVFVDKVDHLREEYLAVAVLLSFIATAVSVEVVDNRIILTTGLVIPRQNYSVVAPLIKCGTVMSKVVKVLDSRPKLYRQVNE